MQGFLSCLIGIRCREAETLMITAKNNNSIVAIKDLIDIYILIIYAFPIWDSVKVH